MRTASKPATAAFALVTGASSGIGAIHADRLAKRGRSVAPLFRPFVLSKLSLANRVVMAPMTRSNRRKAAVHQFDHHDCRITLKATVENASRKLDGDRYPKARPNDRT